MNRPTLCAILAEHQTDKNTLHSYGPVYDQLLLPYRDTARWVLEIGIWGGGSLLAWRDYFSQANIVGVDHDPDKAVFGERLFTVISDQATRDTLIRFPASMGIRYDVIIDDGSHRPEDQILSLFWLYPHLAAGGLYVIEDVQSIDLAECFRCLGRVTVHDLRAGKQRYDDIMIVLRKPD